MFALPSLFYMSSNTNITTPPLIQQMKENKG